MGDRLRPAYLRLAVVLSPLAVSCADASIVSIAPDRDNTLYEIDDGSISNGTGNYLFAGTTATGARRRALLRFDVSAAVPAGSTILSATLSLHVSRTTSAAEQVSLFRVLQDWGEGASKGAGEEGNGGPSKPGDATWIHTFYSTQFWAMAGGDLSPLLTASSIVVGNGTYSWTSVQAAADVQAWLDSPASNFGWAVVGDESAFMTAKRIDSRENPEPTFRPALTVEYTPSPGAAGALVLFAAGLAARRRRAGGVVSSGVARVAVIA